MSNSIDSLSDDEVRQITLLVETLDRSTFDFLQLDVGNLKVTIGKGNVPPTHAAVPGVLAASAVPAPQPAAAHLTTLAPAVPISAPAAAAPSSAQAARNEGPAPDGRYRS